MYQHKRKRKAFKTMGSNVCGDARRLRMKGGVKDESWLSPTMEPVKSVERKGVSNEWLLRSPMMSGIAVDQSGMREPVTSDRTMKEFYGVVHDHKKKWKSVYSGYIHVEKEVKAQMGKIRRTPWSGETVKDWSNQSLLARIEMRADVVLWRSGLAVSLHMARQLCVHGHVEHVPATSVSKRAEASGVVDRGELAVTKLKHPSMRLTPGDMICIKKDQWEKSLPMVKQYWSDAQRVIPPYRRPDFRLGTVVLVRAPRDGEAALPKNMAASLVSLMRR